VPPLAGFFSAVGLLFARHEFHDVRTCQLDARSVAPEELESLFDEMRTTIDGQLPGRDGIDWIRSADLRYRGQSWEIEVPMSNGHTDSASLTELVNRFETEHELLYGFRHEPGSPIQVRAVRLAAVGPARSHQIATPAKDGRATSGETRPAHFEDGMRDARLLTRAAIGAEPVAGPVMIDEYDTTVVVPPQWSVRLDPETQTLVLEREDGHG
jgi:N-methylhydantoinase A